MSKEHACFSNEKIIFRPLGLENQGYKNILLYQLKKKLFKTSKVTQDIKCLNDHSYLYMHGL